ncbi:hypothetical protein ACQEVF_56425 [Nonomuraea polychroma]|uniref:hypothetical protein n=1 Tax=Nonomuraea polychroma TaxID=46176 RepID=UPI003D8AEA4C
MARVRLAGPGEGPAVESLAAAALGMDTGVDAPGSFAAAIDQIGGRLPLSHGSGCALVACADNAPDEVIGLAYVCPPIQLIDAYVDMVPACSSG